MKFRRTWWGGIATCDLLAENTKITCTLYCEKIPRLLVETHLALLIIWWVRGWLSPEFTQLGCGEKQGERPAGAACFGCKALAPQRGYPQAGAGAGSNHGKAGQHQLKH